MEHTLHFDYMVRKLRHFFQDKKGFIEVPAQSRLSILAACEQPDAVTHYTLNGATYPCPQTGQMWLEYELLKQPQWPGVFCITTSYRDEKEPIAGRHWFIFPMFEFESHGTLDDLKFLQEELLVYLGFNAPTSIDYTMAAQRYETQILEDVHEKQLEREFGTAISLEKFPEYTHPFWNMKHGGGGIYHKIDTLLHGMETIGAAERETDTEYMRQRFLSIKNGDYANLLFSKFGKDRVLQELAEFLALPMRQRFGGGIGLTRLERAMQLSNLFDEPLAHSHVLPESTHTSLSF